MNSRRTKAERIESGKWDERSIDSVYESLLDSVGYLLDRVQLTGFDVLLETSETLAVVKQLLQQMEQELLVQWKIKREEGLERLFERQRSWLNRELRCSDGLLTNWNRYCRLVWVKMESPAVLLDRDPWRSLVFEVMTDRDSYRGLGGFMHSQQREEILQRFNELFRRLFDLQPYDLILSFMNLIEIGCGERPEIFDPGALDESIAPGPQSADARKPLFELVSSGHWDDIPKRLMQFWEQKPE